MPTGTNSLNNRKSATSETLTSPGSPGTEKKSVSTLAAKGVKAPAAAPLRRVTISEKAASKTNLWESQRQDKTIINPIVDVEAPERMPPSAEAETAIRRWLEAAGGLEINDLQASLKSGEALCNLMNKIKPGALAQYHRQTKMAFKQMENIGWFLDACLAYGIKTSDLFVTVQLFEGTNMKQVVITLGALRKLAESRGFRV